MDSAALARLIRDIPDFPEPGVVFKDITPLLADAQGFRAAVADMADPFRDAGVDLVVGIEARGFVLSAPVAHELGVGVVPIRKPGKLPYDTHAVTYQLEYGSGSLEMHVDAIGGGSRVLVVDDVLATGGTAAAAADLVRGQGGTVVGFSFLIDLEFLGGRSRLSDGTPLHAVLNYT